MKSSNIRMHHGEGMAAEDVKTADPKKKPTDHL